MKVLILTIIPVVLSTAIYNISGIIDQGVYKALSLDMGVTSSAVNTSWGIFSGKFKTLTNVPIAIANALVSSTIPGLTMCMVERHYKEARTEDPDLHPFHHGADDPMRGGAWACWRGRIPKLPAQRPGSGRRGHGRAHVPGGRRFHRALCHVNVK